MKIVINACYGGFGLSCLAIKELTLANAKCISKIELKEYFGNVNWESYLRKDLKDYKNIGNGFFAHPQDFHVYKDGVLYDFKDAEENRADPDLINVVIKLGETANTRFSNLKIVEIPDNVNWEISEYDGYETIEEQHQKWN